MLKLLLILFLLNPLFFSTNKNNSESNTERYISITFDDLPMNSSNYKNTSDRKIFTVRLMEKISANKIPVIGFVNMGKCFNHGEINSAKIDLLKLWLQDSLSLGNHTFSHYDLHKVELSKFLDDIVKGEEVLKKLAGEFNQNIKYFRHPYLHTGTSPEVRAEVEKFLAEKEYTIAPVTMDNSEWMFAYAYDHAASRNDTLMKIKIGNAYIDYMDQVFEYYEKQSVAILGYELKQILLLHSNLLNADYFDKLIEKLKERKYNFISLDAALTDPAYKSEDKYFGNSGITWLHRWALTQGKRGKFFAGEPEVPMFISEVYKNKSY